jgi:hypothetical protein
VYLEVGQVEETPMLAHSVIDPTATLQVLTHTAFWNSAVALVPMSRLKKRLEYYSVAVPGLPQILPSPSLGANNRLAPGLEYPYTESPIMPSMKPKKTKAQQQSVADLSLLGTIPLAA